NSNIQVRNLSTPANRVLADFDNDGIKDMLDIGNVETGRLGLQFHLGTGLAFNDFLLYESPRAVQYQSLEKGDLDNDGDVDFFVFAQPDFPNNIPEIYLNNAAQGWTRRNEAPSVPTGLKIIYGEGGRIDLSWNAATDDNTPAKSLSYNVFLTRNDSVMINSWSNTDGSRQRYVKGNTGYGSFFPLRNLPPGNYKARVQSIDNSYLGSSFSAEIEFGVGAVKPAG